MIRPAKSLRRIGPLLLALGAAARAPATPPLVVFSPERAPLPIYVAAEAAPGERAAAEELARVLARLSGFPAVKIGIEPPAESAGRGVFIGRTRTAARLAPPLPSAADWFAPQPGEVAPDTIRLSADADRLFIEAASPEATEFAVAWLLQRHAGVRWLFPGAAGEIAPRRPSWELPGDLCETHAPAFVSRDIFVGNAPDDLAWAKHNGLRARMEFSHALNRVFTAREADAHPEWFAEVRGQRLRPRSAEDYHWQPNLARTEVAAFAAEQARAALAADPARRSFSLGMNDTVRFDQGPETRALVEPLPWFRGMPDYSPLVFTFMNRAAASLDAAHVAPDRYLGCLAYFWCENAPAFPVHPRVVPFVTTDRAQFFDANYRAAEIELLRRWGKSGVRTFGLWDYAYGSGFLVPRQPLHALAEGIREGHRAGARAYFADASSPEWGFDAFKLWMIARLLWEPERSVEELADDFFPVAYGPAAPAMREFFARCERQWMGQGGAAYWLKFHQHEDQATLFPPTAVEALTKEVDRAAAAVFGAATRAPLLPATAKSWARAAAFVRFDAARRAIAGGRDPAAPGRQMTPAAGLASLQLSRAGLQRLSGAELTPFVRNDPVPQLIEETDPALMSVALRGLENLTPVPARWKRQAEWVATRGKAPAANRLRNGHFGISAARGQEPAFLFPRGGELPADWEWRAVATERQQARLLPPTVGEASRVLRIEGAWDTQVFQWNPAQGGKFYVVRLRARGAASLGSDAGLFLSFLDAAGRPVGEHRVQTLPRNAGEPERWLTLVLADEAPAGTAWIGVGLAASRQVGGDWFEARDVELVEADAAGNAPRN